MYIHYTESFRREKEEGDLINKTQEGERERKRQREEEAHLINKGNHEKCTNPNANGKPRPQAPCKKII